MNRNQAIAKARKLLGPKAMIRRDPAAPDADTRKAQQETKRALRNAMKAAESALAARRSAVLAADAEFQRLLTEWKADCADYEKTPSGTRHRYSVGCNGSLFFSVEAQGDTLSEAIANLESRIAKARAA